MQHKRGRHSCAFFLFFSSVARCGVCVSRSGVHLCEVARRVHVLPREAAFNLHTQAMAQQNTSDTTRQRQRWAHDEGAKESKVMNKLCEFIFLSKRKQCDEQFCDFVFICHFDFTSDTHLNVTVSFALAALSVLFPDK